MDLFMDQKINSLIGEVERLKQRVRVLEDRVAYDKQVADERHVDMTKKINKPHGVR